MLTLEQECAIRKAERVQGKRSKEYEYCPVLVLDTSRTRLANGEKLVKLGKYNHKYYYEQQAKLAKEIELDLYPNKEKKVRRRKSQVVGAQRKFLSSKEWKEVRKIALDYYGRTCMRCGATEQIQVDHVLPKSTHPDLRLEVTNLQILCWTCNKRKGATYAEYRGI